MSLPTLWGTMYCPYVQRAKIVFALVGKAYTFKAIDLGHKPAEYDLLALSSPLLPYIPVTIFMLPPSAWPLLRGQTEPVLLLTILLVGCRFLKLSPYHKVPVLVDDGKVIYESAAINQYIDEKWGDSKLMGYGHYIAWTCVAHRNTYEESACAIAAPDLNIELFP
jgi:hypothetical protein